MEETSSALNMVTGAAPLPGGESWHPPVVLWCTDSDLRITGTSGGESSRLGLRAGKVLTECFGTRAGDGLLIAAHHRALGGESVAWETDWEGHTYRGHVSPFRGRQGDIVGCVGFAQDITDRKQTEAGLPEAHAELERRLQERTAELLKANRQLERETEQRKRLQETLRQRTDQLGERIKELQCLYDLSHIVQQPGTTLDEVFQAAVDLIPAAWQYPEVTCARIVVADREYTTANFVQTAWKQAGEIFVGGKRIGTVEVYYREEKAEADEGPFLEGERSLLDEITDRLGAVAQRLQAEETLRQTARELHIYQRIAKVFLSVPDDEMYAEVLQVVLGAMQSKWGTFGYIDEGGAYVIPSLTRNVWDECRIPDKDIRFPRETWGNGVWCCAIREKRSLYSNQPARVPEGHIPISRNLAVPIIYRGEVIGLIQVANKLTDYGEQDVRLLETIASHIAPILHARLQRNAEEREHKRARREAEEARIYAETIVHTVRESLVVLDADLRVLSANRSFYETFQVDAAQTVGCPLYDLGNGQWDIPRLRHLFERIVSEQTPFDNFEVQHDFPHLGPRTMVLNARPVLGEYPPPRLILLAIEDITERKRVEEERERLIEALEAANAELERFTYTVSHDLKSPLITIKGFLGQLEQDAACGRGDRMKGDMARMRRAAERMHGFLDDLLELSRIGRVANPSENVPLGELARKAVNIVAGSITERGVKVEIAPDLPVVFGDRRRLVEVFQNLIENALKFMGEQPDPRVEIGARHQGDQTVCYVRDNGIGINPRYHQRVFELFDKLDHQSEGTGVGLALVKRIIEVHGGRIWVESEGEGHGCTFCFTLPSGDEGH